ncbi:MAG: hypothetical protein WKG01_03215 [Kofleriaceae bacterium]
MADWVLAIERAYVAAATGSVASAGQPALAHARAAVGAIASHYLAVGTPRSFGLVADAATAADAALSLEAHRTWFAPRDVRSTIAGPGRLVELAEALACDIVCIHLPLALAARQLRRGTHVNVLAEVVLDADLAQLATVVHEEPGLGALAAGLVDGRQLDELTVFVVGSLATARS